MTGEWFFLLIFLRYATVVGPFTNPVDCESARVKAVSSSYVLTENPRTLNCWLGRPR